MLLRDGGHISGVPILGGGGRRGTSLRPAT